MNSQDIITKIEIITGEKKKLLNKDELKKFCDEKVRISVTLVDDGVQRIRDCQVILNKMSSEYIQKALGGKMTRGDKKRQIEIKLRVSSSKCLCKCRGSCIHF